MPIDPRRLRPSGLAKLLNSTPLGTVIDERQLYRHRVRAGYLHQERGANEYGTHFPAAAVSAATIS
jgi:hypothetical protein